MESISKGFFYFASPYTVKDQHGNFVPEGEEANFNLCNYRSGRLLLAGYNIYSPISHTHPIHRATPEFLQRHEHTMWYELDLDFIEKTNFDGIILAPNWEESAGCRLEKNWFEQHGKIVLFYANIIEENIGKD